MLSQRSYNCCWLAQLWPGAGLFLEPAGTGSVWHGGTSQCLLTEATLQPPHYQNLVM